MDSYNRIECPKCKSPEYKKLKDIIGIMFVYYRCKRCGNIWWEQKNWKDKGQEEQPSGDNYPLLPDNSGIPELVRERKALIKELFKRGYKKITKDDVIDMAIELGLYNQRCKKKRKRKKK